MSLFAPVLAAFLLLALQGLLLQTACSISGERPPPYGEALLTSIVAGICAALGSGAFSCTLGLLVGWFSGPLATLGAVGIGVAVTAAVYRSRLRTSAPQALGIALLHHLMAGLASGLVWLLVRGL